MHSSSDSDCSIPDPQAKHKHGIPILQKHKIVPIKTKLEDTQNIPYKPFLLHFPFQAWIFLPQKCHSWHHGQCVQTCLFRLRKRRNVQIVQIKVHYHSTPKNIRQKFTLKNPCLVSLDSTGLLKSSRKEIFDSTTKGRYRSCERPINKRPKESFTTNKWHNRPTLQ